MKRDLDKEQLGFTDEQIVNSTVDALPKILAFIVVLILGIFIFFKIENIATVWLSQYIISTWILSILVTALSFGPLFYLEEKLEKVIARILAKLMKKQLDEGKKLALENLKKKQLDDNLKQK